jgi:mono/diheme cytochrome c family protein
VKRLVLIGITVIVILIAGAWIAFSLFNLSALPEPGTRETYFATKAKHLLVRRAARLARIPAAPADVKASAAEGDKYFSAECSMCHGLDGRTATSTGRWMYPRVVDLGSAEAQSYSDRELFWIVKNGIRLSGMPAFGKVDTDGHIWDLVEYVRTLRPEAKTN